MAPKRLRWAPNIPIQSARRGTAFDVNSSIYQQDHPFTSRKNRKAFALSFKLRIPTHRLYKEGKEYDACPCDSETEENRDHGVRYGVLLRLNNYVALG
jgi:hypothetical protein